MIENLLAKTTCWPSVWLCYLELSWTCPHLPGCCCMHLFNSKGVSVLLYFISNLSVGTWYLGIFIFWPLWGTWFNENVTMLKSIMNLSPVALCAFMFLRNISVHNLVVGAAGSVHTWIASPNAEVGRTQSCITAHRKAMWYFSLESRVMYLDESVRLIEVVI